MFVNMLDDVRASWRAPGTDSIQNALQTGSKHAVVVITWCRPYLVLAEAQQQEEHVVEW